MIANLIKSLGQPIFGKGGPGSGPHPGGGHGKPGSTESVNHGLSMGGRASEQSAVANAAGAKADASGKPEDHAAAAYHHGVARNMHGSKSIEVLNSAKTTAFHSAAKAEHEKEYTRHTTAAGGVGMSDRRHAAESRNVKADAAGELDKSNSSRTANELNAGIFADAAVDKAADEDNFDFEKGGPGSGPHPGHKAAGELSAKARATSTAAGGQISAHAAVIAHHKEAEKAHYKAADAYRKLADAHENVAYRHGIKAERGADKAEG